MVDKKEPAKGWPVVKGEYDAGDPKSPVAVATCGSHFNLFPIKAGAGISGPFKTENLGIEKIVANVISNPNIRYAYHMRLGSQGTYLGRCADRAV